MKRNIAAHMALTKAQRQAHTNTSSACIKQTGNTPKHGSALAKRALLEYHNIEKFNGAIENVQTAHLCANNSQAPNGFVCINPLHLYFGTASENNMDKTPQQRKAAGYSGAPKATKSAMMNGNHMSQTKITCPHCKKQGLIGPMKRWHFDNCKSLHTLKKNTT